MEEGISEQIAVNSFWNFLVIFFARLGGLVFIIIVARFLLPESFGLYNLALSVSLILITALDVGINQTLMRYIAEALGKKKKELASAEFKYLLKLKLSITLGLAILLILLSYPLSFFVFKKPALFLPLLFSSIYILSYSFGSFYNVYFYVIKKVDYISKKQFIFEISRIVGVLLLFLFVAREYYIIGTIGILSVTMFFATLYLIYNLKKLSPYIFDRSNEKVEKKRIFKFFIYLGIIGSFLVIFGYVDIIMIGSFLDAEYVGFYTAGLALVAGIWSFLNISNILLPVFTQMKDHDLHAAFNRVFKYLTILAIPSIFGIFALGRYFINIIYGSEYLPAVLPFYILSILVLEIPLIHILTSLFSAKEKPKYVIKLVVIATLMNIILNYFLISSFLKVSADYAIMGAAIATLTSQTFYLFGLLIYAKKELKIKLHFSYLIKPIIASVIMMAILLFLNSMLDVNLLIGILEIILGVVIYFSIMILIKGVEKTDIHLLKEVIKKLRKR